MANQPTPAPKPAPFTRLTHPDPQINLIVQDIYSKLNQIWRKVNDLQNK